MRRKFTADEIEEVKLFGQLHDAIFAYVRLHVDNEDLADDIYQQVIDIIIERTDQ